MDKSTILFRQIHPKFFKKGRILECAFDPFDHNDISVYDGSKITAKESYNHYKNTFNLESIGVAGLLVEECEQTRVTVTLAPSVKNPAHCLIDFSNIPVKERRLKVMRLCLLANKRGLVYKP